MEKTSARHATKSIADKWVCTMATRMEPALSEVPPTSLMLGSGTEGVERAMPHTEPSFLEALGARVGRCVAAKAEGGWGPRVSRGVGCMLGALEVGANDCVARVPCAGRTTLARRRLIAITSVMPGPHCTLASRARALPRANPARAARPLHIRASTLARDVTPTSSLFFQALG